LLSIGPAAAVTELNLVIDTIALVTLLTPLSACKALKRFMFSSGVAALKVFIRDSLLKLGISKLEISILFSFISSIVSCIS